MSNVLITGGLSLIGSNYINYSLSNGRYKTIVNIDMVQFPGTEYNISKRDDPSYVFIRGDMGDMDLVSDILTRYDIDYVIHIAAFSHVDKSFDDPLSFTENNVLGTHKLIEACRKYGRVKKFIHFGTDEVYGEVDINHPGCKETESLDPTNPYSGSKAAAEMIVSSYYHSFDFPVVTIRCNNVFGPNQYPEKLIPRFIMLLKEG